MDCRRHASKYMIQVIIMEIFARLSGLSAMVNKISVISNRNIFINNCVKTITDKKPWQMYSTNYITTSQWITVSTDKILSNIRYYVLCNQRISRNDANLLMQAIKVNKVVTAEQSLHAVNCLGSNLREERSHDRMKLLLELWHFLQASDVKLDIVHYNTLLKVYLENDYRFSIDDFIRKLKSHGFAPNHDTYRYLIQECCQTGDMDRVNKLMENVTTNQYPHNLDIFNALILGYSRAGNYQAATHEFNSIQKAGLKPNQKSYTNLLNGYAKHGHISTILSLLEEYKSKNIILRGSDILEIINELTVNDYAHATEQLYTFIQPSQGYNQDAINQILYLINDGYDNIAYEILKTLSRTILPNGDLENIGDFFIKQLVKVKRPIDTILKFCNAFEENRLSLNSYINLLWTLTQNNLTEEALYVLKTIKANNIALTPEHFRTLFKPQTQHNITKIIHVLQQEFQCKFTLQFVREVVVQNLDIVNPENIILSLRNAGISQYVAASAVAFHCIRKNQVEKAASIIKRFKIILNPKLVRNELIWSTVRTRDFDNYIKIALHFYKHHSQLEKRGISNDAHGTGADQSEALGELVYDTLKMFPADLQSNFVTYVLTALLKRGISISAHQAKRIEKTIQSDNTNEIGELLQKHASGLSKTLLLQNSRSESEINANYAEIFNEINNEHFIVSEQSFIKSICRQADYTDLSRAFETFKKFKTKDTTFNITISTILKIVPILIKHDQLNEVKKICTLHRKKISDRQSQFHIERSCWGVMKMLAENGKVNDVYDLFDCFVNYKFIQPNNSILGPLIKVHLINNDVMEAVNAFKRLSTRYQCTPLRNELMSRLIYDNDDKNIRKVIELSSKQHGEHNALLDYSFSLIECNRVPQAESVLESLGSHINHNRILSMCNSYAKSGDTVFIERFLLATETITLIIRHDIYLILLDCYCRDCTPKNAINLWINMKKNNEIPSLIFLKILAAFLQSKNVEVPFEIPKIG